ncbi:MAG: discoidin domain-containing protein [Phycisphaerae bacterium]|nr:discoidin domain-containing protein [Phycisphaerae bacterium]
MTSIRIARVLPLVMLLAIGFSLRPAVGDDAAWKAQIQADWLLQEKFNVGARVPLTGSRRAAPTKSKLTTTIDAAGGVDGVKSGKWGFHTASESNPWWRVDLGKSQPIGKIVLWNRCDSAGMAVRTSRIMVLLSDDAKMWRKVYTHNGRTFGGVPDKKPLTVELVNKTARYIRLQLSGKTYLHLDEVEIFAPGGAKNIALRKAADQSSVSQWSTGAAAASPAKAPAKADPKLARRVGEIIKKAQNRVAEFRRDGVDVSGAAGRLEKLIARVGGMAPDKIDRETYFAARWILRELTLADPLLGFRSMLVTKRVPGSYSHMSDQYYGWWSRPGGGIHIVDDITSDNPKLRCLTDSFKHAGSFLRPMISYDAKRVVFAWCRHYPKLRGERNKVDKSRIAEDAFYHVYEMNIDGSGVRRLTHGKYDNFDARYMPDNRIVFLSTRRGQDLQVGCESTARSLSAPDRPNVYVRCGGGSSRPVAVYTLHSMKPDGSDLRAISPFEEFEWTPAIHDDGTILHARWDYVDRHNNAFMSLWSVNPDGSNARIVYGNYTRSPHCIFEARCIPNSHKLIFTASAHHAQTMGSLVLLDTTVDIDGPKPLKRLTPEVTFPEIERTAPSQYAHPWPLSERMYLTSWGAESQVREGRSRINNGFGVYLFDAQAGTMELLHRDPAISTTCPIAIAPRKRQPIFPENLHRKGPQEGVFLISDIYRGLKTVKRGEIKSVRIIAVPPKCQPTMHSPPIGLTREDPGKCVLGSVPVEADGSANFRVPSGVIVFFQAIDSRGMAVQTMRSTTHVQPGQTLSCVGCHERRNETPVSRSLLAAKRAPSKITLAPSGSWPLRFDRLVQPVLDAKCVKCHNPKSSDVKGRKFNLSGVKAYASLCAYGKPSLRDQVHVDYRKGISAEGNCIAANSAVMTVLYGPKGHYKVKLTAEERHRLIVWMDAYAQRAGSFSDDQELQLNQLRRRYAGMLIDRYQTGVKTTSVTTRLFPVQNKNIGKKVLR